MAPLGGVERPRRVVRFARLIHRRVRVLGGPAVGAAFGGHLSLPWLPLTVVRQIKPPRSLIRHRLGWEWADRRRDDQDHTSGVTHSTGNGSAWSDHARWTGLHAGRRNGRPRQTVRATGGAPC